VRRDPYRVLGVPPTASAEKLHDAYRELIKLHHPDRNGGSAESTARFQEIQAAYEELRNRPRAASAARASSESVEERMAKLEGEVRAAQAERAKAREAARKALRDLEPKPAPPAAEPVEEEDSISAILFDIIDEIGERIAGPREPDVNDLIDGLDDLSSRLDGKP
jgi:curved DNA-binding protein CbpA